MHGGTDKQRAIFCGTLKLRRGRNLTQGNLGGIKRFLGVKKGTLSKFDELIVGLARLHQEFIGDINFRSEALHFQAMFRIGCIRVIYAMLLVLDFFDALNERGPPYY